MSAISDFYISDEDIDLKNDEKVVENILHPNKAHRKKKTQESRSKLQISNFTINNHKPIHADQDLILEPKTKHSKIKNKVEKSKKKTFTLPKPLEKPKADRVKRLVNYEKNRFLFDRWEAFVASNRAQAHQTFPLESVKKLKETVKSAVNFEKDLTYKSKLQLEIEKLNTEVEEYNIQEDVNENEEVTLTLKELKERRKELSKLRAHQRYKEAKLRRQNKIKSKKYHRLLRKEKIKQKLNEFEILQKTNPEEALKKLEEIEKARVLERFSLRHKGTSQWAKSKQVRAKYDKESRQMLAEQLQISKDLTQKKKVESDSEDDASETEQSLPSNTGENPWTRGPKVDQEVSEFLNSFKKFQSKLHKTKQDNEDNSTKNKDTDVQMNESLDNECLEETNDEIDIKKPKKKGKTEKQHKILPTNVLKKVQSSQDDKKNLKRSDKKLNLINKKKLEDVEDILTNVENKLKQRIEKGESKNARKARQVGQSQPIKKKKVTKKIDLSMPSQNKKQVIDEEMIEQPVNSNPQIDSSEMNGSIDALKTILNVETNSKSQIKDSTTDKVKPKTTNLVFTLPNLIVENDQEEDTNQVMIEAFEDDDIAKDFSKEKKAEVENDKPHDIDLNLPGWGSWAGTGIKLKKQRKRRRFIVKMPEVLPRRDDNKGSLIINEKAAVKIKSHLVSDVPFPFKTVKDYECSIRAPIGNSFVPEIAYRKYIKPAIQTKMGTIIEPVNTKVLMGVPN
ncbi:hypothetical protein ABEB36_014106 [Hypothenemus hampei]|uniref:U3 small nucleolar RNA-associated protein 14 homolog A n=1 Tax=Hypothenemus hampei TaxID=57062 RepID=A0ABD1E5F1_HYPHA